MFVGTIFSQPTGRNKTKKMDDIINRHFRHPASITPSTPIPLRAAHADDNGNRQDGGNHHRACISASLLAAGPRAAAGQAQAQADGVAVNITNTRTIILDMGPLRRPH